MFRPLMLFPSPRSFEMYSPLVRIPTILVATLGIFLLVVQTSKVGVCDLLPEASAAQLIGGDCCEGEEQHNSCCVFQGFCDGTELLCSNNPSLLCIDGLASGFRLRAVNNRDDCSHYNPTVQGVCVRSHTEEACSYTVSCIWDEQLLKCLEDAPSDNMVPICCEDTCGQN
jgi:hypothetical protein